MEKIFKNKKYAIGFSILAMFLWGSAIPMIKTTYEVFSVAGDDVGSKIYLAGIRFFMAGLMTYGYYLIFNREKLDFSKVNKAFIIKLALVQTTIQYLFYYIGLSNTLGVKASVIQASNAFIIVILARLLLEDELITRQKLLSLLVGTLGILVVNMGQGTDFNLSLTGEGFILIATTFGALGTVLLRKYGGDQNSFIVISFQLLLGSIPLIVVGFLTAKTGLIMNLKGFMLLLYGAFVSATAFTLWSLVLKYQSAGEFGIYKLFIPIFGSILSVLILGERFTIRLLLGLVLVLLGSLILNIDLEGARKK